ncbi:MAG TPA: response regulator [Planctomycetota bacterium]|nr:response regulator [Planctomycetota bacterium]
MSRVITRHLILCVDDEPPILAALARSLRNDPYEILTTERPDRALRWVETREISLIISDQRMPGMQGTELLEEVSRYSPSTARIILTAYPGATVSCPGLRQRTDCIISKPWDPGMLRRTVRYLLLERELTSWDQEMAGSL